MSESLTTAWALAWIRSAQAAMAEHRAATEDVLDAAERITGISGEGWRSRMRSRRSMPVTAP